MATSEFVTRKLALLDTGLVMTQEQIDAAWSRVQQRAAAPPPARRIPPRWAIGMGVAATLAIALLTPDARVLAQSVWRSIVLWQAAPVTLDMANTSMDLLLPNVFPLHQNGETWRTADQAEAERLAGFHVLTLASPHQPSFRVEQQPEIARVVDLAAIRAELTRLGRPMVEAPDGIDGARIVLRPGSRLAVTSYGECPQIKGMWRACAFLVQARPKVLTLPPNVMPEPFVQFSLELAGLPSAQARQLQRLAGADPAIYLPNEAGSTVEPVTVRGHRGFLVRSPGNGAHVLQWQDTEFHFELHTRDAAGAVALAETLR